MRASRRIFLKFILLSGANKIKPYSREVTYFNFKMQQTGYQTNFLKAFFSLSSCLNNKKKKDGTIYSLSLESFRTRYMFRGRYLDVFFVKEWVASMDGVWKGLVSSLVLLRAHSYSGGVTYHPLSKLYSSLQTYHLGYLKNLKKNMYILTHTYIHLATPETKTALQINSMSIKILKVWPKIFKVMCVNLKPLIA